jgi:hypothetical protein
VRAARRRLLHERLRSIGFQHAKAPFRSERTEGAPDCPRASGSRRRLLRCRSRRCGRSKSATGSRSSHRGLPEERSTRPHWACRGMLHSWRAASRDIVRRDEAHRARGCHHPSHRPPPDLAGARPRDALRGGEPLAAGVPGARGCHSQSAVHARGTTSSGSGSPASRLATTARSSWSGKAASFNRPAYNRSSSRSDIESRSTPPTRSSVRGRCSQRSRISAARGSETARSRSPCSISASLGGSRFPRVERLARLNRAASRALLPRPPVLSSSTRMSFTPSGGVSFVRLGREQSPPGDPSRAVGCKPVQLFYRILLRPLD